MRQTLDLSFRGTRAVTLFRRNCGAPYTRSCKIVNFELGVCVYVGFVGFVRVFGDVPEFRVACFSVSISNWV